MTIPREGNTETGRAVRDGLIDAGETLIGENGVEGASLRKISALAGTRNNYAVQYHFGDLDGLIHEIIARRTPEIERRRGAALHDARLSGPLSTRVLLDLFFLPLLDLTDASGNPRFARFTNALHKTPDGWRPLDDMLFMMPVTKRILDGLKEANPMIPAPVIWQRLRPISVMVLSFACADTVTTGAASYRETIRASLLDMAEAALAVPVRDNVASMVYGFLF